MSKTIGILGGMGPMATDDLFHKILMKTEADTDQAYPRIVIDCNTQIPDRTRAILKEGEDPVPQMVKSAVCLQEMGADVLVIACNTAHYFYDQIVPFVNIPILHMPNETAARLRRSGEKKVALLATDGTVQSGVYKKAFDREGIELLLPSKEGQQSVMELIYQGVKKNNFLISTDRFRKEIDSLFDRGAETLVLGCTELPIAFRHFRFDPRITDPTDILAECALLHIGCRIRSGQTEN